MVHPQALILLRAGRSWRTGALAAAGPSAEGGGAPPPPGTAEDEAGGSADRRLQDELDVVSLFADEPDAPFSIQRIALAGVGQGTPVGKWFGPKDRKNCAKLMEGLYDAKLGQFPKVADDLLVC